MKITEYIRSFLPYDNKILPDMEDQTKTWADTRSFIEPEVARLICLLIRLTGAKKVLELGTCIAYSGIWMAESLKITGGKLTSIDYDPRLITEAKQNFKKANLLDYINLIEADITKELPKIPDESFDIVFQDAKKSLYPLVLEDCIRIVKKGGLIIADDALYRAKGITEKLSAHTHKYNEMIFKDKRLYSTIVNAGDGLTISVKQPA
jgi:predicted O-methyltransferase YrrM